MLAALIGFFSAIVIIVFVALLNDLDKKLIYALTLSGIGFLYVGFAWMDLQSLIINSIQAILFLFLSYYGMKRSINLLAFGYFLHGAWDLAYHSAFDSSLIPPHYDWFCSILDFTIGIYLLIISRPSKFNVVRQHAQHFFHNKTKTK